MEKEEQFLQEEGPRPHAEPESGRAGCKPGLPTSRGVAPGPPAGGLGETLGCWHSGEGLLRGCVPGTERAVVLRRAVDRRGRQARNVGGEIGPL